MLSVGLTGGIGSGKTAVAALLRAHGAVVIDADLLARSVVEPGTPGLAEVVDAFGADVLTEDGALDRAKLGELVFSNPEERARLNAIVHPRVARERLRRLEALPEDTIVVSDVPLLVENHLESDYDVVLVVDVPTDVQVARLVEHRGMTEEQARSRIAAQTSRERRRAVADILVDNSGSHEDLARRVEQVWKLLTSRDPSPRQERGK